MKKAFSETAFAILSILAGVCSVGAIICVLVLGGENSLLIPLLLILAAMSCLGAAAALRPPFGAAAEPDTELQGNAGNLSAEQTREIAISNIITGYLPPKTKLQDYLTANGIELKYPLFLVLQITAIREDLKEPPEPSDADEIYKECRLFLHASLACSMDGRVHMYSCIIDGRETVLFNFDAPNADASISAIISSAEAATEYVKERLPELRPQALISIGTMQRDLYYINNSYIVAVGLTEHNFENNYSGGHSVISIQNVRGRQGGNISVEVKKRELVTRFFNYVISKDFLKARDMLLEYVELESGYSILPLSQTKELVSDRVDFLMEYLGITASTLHGMPEDFWKYTAKLINYADTQEELVRNVRIIFDMLAKNFEVDGSETTRKIGCYTNFIQENFADPNLNVEAVCDHFNVSLSYLSRLFKENCGMGALDYIHSQRIALARELLKTDDSLESIARKCGYLNRRALSTVFKRYEGITPGECRQGLR